MQILQQGDNQALHNHDLHTYKWRWTEQKRETLLWCGMC